MSICFDQKQFDQYLEIGGMFATAWQEMFKGYDETIDKIESGQLNDVEKIEKAQSDLWNKHYENLAATAENFAEKASTPTEKAMRDSVAKHYREKANDFKKTSSESLAKAFDGALIKDKAPIQKFLPGVADKIGTAFDFAGVTNSFAKGDLKGVTVGLIQIVAAEAAATAAVAVVGAIAAALAVEGAVAVGVAAIVTAIAAAGAALVTQIYGKDAFEKAADVLIPYFNQFSDAVLGLFGEPGALDGTFESIEDLYRAIDSAISNALNCDEDNDIADKFNEAQSLTQRDPLIIDLDRDGIETLGTNARVLFDHDADGLKQGTGWVARDDGLLVIDRNKNGRIDNGRELFGDNTIKLDGKKAIDGFDALRDLDDNKDGVIDAKDKAFTSLKVWQDKNSDGITQAGELLDLLKLKITSIALSIKNIQETQNGNRISHVSDILFENGETTIAGNTWFQSDTYRREFPDQIPLTEQAKKLPKLRGSGGLRDLQEAVSLDPKLAALVQEFAAAKTHDAQTAILDKLIYAWAATGSSPSRLSKLEEYNKDAISKNIDYFARLHAGQTFDSGSNVGSNFNKTKYEELLKKYRENPPKEVFAAASARNNGGQYLWAVVDIPMALADKSFSQLFALERFNGRIFNEQITTATSGAVVPLLNPLLEIQKPVLEQAYEELSSYIFTSLSMQTRLRPYLDAIKLGQDTNKKAALDFSGVKALLEKKLSSDKMNGIFDIIDLARARGRTFFDSGFDIYTYIKDTIKSKRLTTAEIARLNHVGYTNTLTTTNKTDILFGDSAVQDIDAQGGDDIVFGEGGNDRILGGSGIDILLGGDGDDQLFGQTGNDTLIGNTGNDTLYGDEGDDMLYGGSGDDFLSGEFGNDILEGDAGKDILSGAAGNDRLEGGADDDTLNGDSGNDRLIGGAGNDQITGGSDNDTLDGGDGLDYLYGNDGIDTLDGGNGVDYLYGNDGDDTLQGGADNDTLEGHKGDDSLNGGRGNDSLRGGEGNDTYRFARGDGQDTIDASGSEMQSDILEFIGGIASNEIAASRRDTDLILTLTTSGDRITVKRYFDNDATTSFAIKNIRFSDTTWDIAKVKIQAQISTNGNDQLYGYSNTNDQLSGGAGDDLLWGYGGDDTLKGEAGNDTLEGGDGKDILDGGDGNDSLSGQLGNDQLLGGLGDDTLSGGEGLDTLDGGNGNDRLYGEAANDQLTGGLGNDELYGDTGDDILNSGDGNDRLNGGLGADQMSGGHGDDYYLVDNTSDKVTEVADPGNDIIESSVTYALPVNVETLLLTGTADINGTGGAAAETLIGNSGKNRLDAGAGNDTLDGGAGIDTLIGGTGDDLYKVDNSADVISEKAGEGTDRVEATSNYTLSDNLETLILLEAAGYSEATGNALDNTLIGNSTHNRLDGKAGRDTMTGGTGDDVYVIDRADDIIVEKANEGRDRVESSITYALKAHFEDITLIGSAHIDATGDGLANTLIGNDGNNRLDGGAGADQLSGGAGNDYYIIDIANDVVSESAGAGTDTVERRYETEFYLAANVENLILGSGVMRGNGNELNNVITGNAIDNNLAGYDGDDTVLGGDGKDSLFGGNGTDRLEGGAGDDYLEGDAGDDLLLGDAGDDQLNAEAGKDTLIGGAGDDKYVLRPDFGSAVIDNSGGGIKDIVMFDAVFTAQRLSYSRIGDDLVITVDKNPAQTVRVIKHFLGGDFAIDYVQPGGGNMISTAEINQIVAGGSSSGGFDRVIKGSAAGENLQGSAGKDFIEGLAGNDQLFGFEGDDKLDGGDGDDYLAGGYGNKAGTGNDTLLGGAGKDTLAGEDGVNKLVGGAGDDTYSYGGGQDTIDNTGGGVKDGLFFKDGITAARLGFSRDGNDLVITVDGNAAKTVRVTGHFLGGDLALDFVQPDGGFMLDTAAINKLVAGSVAIPNIKGTSANDILNGSASAERLEGLAGNDQLSGLAGDDQLLGGDGNDTLLGGSGSNQLVGGAGDDNYVYGGGQDVIDNSGGGTKDGVFFKDGITAAKLAFSRVGDDLLITALGDASKTVRVTGHFLGGDKALDFVQPDGGSLLDTAAINKLAEGGSSGTPPVGTLPAGYDKLVTGTNGADTQLTGTTGKDFMQGLAGDDVLFGMSGNDSLDGGDGNDYLTGGSGDAAGTGNDVLIGGLGDDQLDGEDGDDTLRGGAGNDKYYYGLKDGKDVIDASGGGQDWLMLRDGIKRTQLSFFRQGDDLVVRIDNDANQQITVQKHFLGGEFALYALQPNDGGFALMTADINKLAKPLAAGSVAALSRKPSGAESSLSLAERKRGAADFFGSSVIKALRRRTGLTEPTDVSLNGKRGAADFVPTRAVPANDGQRVTAAYASSSAALALAEPAQEAAVSRELNLLVNAMAGFGVSPAAVLGSDFDDSGLREQTWGVNHRFSMRTSIQ